LGLNNQGARATGILVRSVPATTIDYIAAMKKVQAKHGVGLFSQIVEILRLAFGKNKIHPSDYFNYGIYHPDLNAVEKREYLSNTSITALNSKLSPDTLPTLSSFINDKLLFGQLMNACGFPTSRNMGVFSPQRKFGFIKILGNAAEIAAFITDKKNLPLFAKPVFGSRSLGGVSIVDSAQGLVTLGDGRQVDAADLANEIVENYGKGYLFQALLVQPPEIERIVGKTAATIRVVTVQSKKGPQVLYSIWKHPKKGAMIDSGSTGGSAVALIDLETGRISRCQQGYCLDGGPIENSFTTGVPIIGFQIPHWDEIRRLAASAHNLFADHGVLGWDFVITTEGPIINEVNANPLHFTYQRAADRGFMNADIAPVIEQSLQEMERRIHCREKHAKTFSMSLLYGITIGKKGRQAEPPLVAFPTEVAQSNIDLFATMDKVKKEHGRGHYSQAFEMVKLAFGSNKISPEIYFSHALYRPSISKQEKKAYISRASSTVVNRRMAPKQLANMGALTEDKLLSGYLLRACGFPATRNEAVFMPDRDFGFIRTLKSADQISDYITTKKNLPVFGKPMYGSRSLGGVSVVDCSRDKARVTLGNGREIEAQSLAEEIVKHHGMGYLFQELLEQPADVQAIVGTTAATLKISTVMTEDGPEVLYAVWKQPAPGQMIDGGGAGTSGLAHVDIETGKVIRVQEGNLLSGGPISHSVTTGVEMIGMDVPNWQASIDLALSAHHLFSDHGILGWDIVLTTRGPVINEVNANTGHIIIQLASDQGFWNPQMRAILERGIAETDRKIAAR